MTYTIEPVLLLPHFLKEFQALGGKLQAGVKVTDLAALGDRYDLVINCTGVWAGELTGDKRVSST